MMNPALEQLKGIHLPAAVSWWPLSMTALVTIAIIIISAVAIIYTSCIYWQRTAGKRRAIKELNLLYNANVSEPQYSLAYCELIRRYAVHLAKSNAQLQGDAWFHFLAQYMPEQQASWIAIQRYQAHTAMDKTDLHAAGLNFIKGKAHVSV